MKGIDIFDLTCAEVCEVIARAWVGDNQGGPSIEGNRFNIGSRDVIARRADDIIAFEDKKTGKVLWDMKDNGEVSKFDEWCMTPGRLFN